MIFPVISRSRLEYMPTHILHNKFERERERWREEKEGAVRREGEREIFYFIYFTTFVAPSSHYLSFSLILPSIL